jgi:hypothetical protein
LPESSLALLLPGAVATPVFDGTEPRLPGRPFLPWYQFV